MINNNKDQQKSQGTSCLIPEPPLLVLPHLAAKIGLNEAIALQQLHYWLLRSEHIKNNRKWAYNTFKQWQEQFPFWSIDTIKRTFYNLEEAGIVVSDNFNKNKFNRTKWYSINYDEIPKIALKPSNDR